MEHCVELNYTKDMYAELISNDLYTTVLKINAFQQIYVANFSKKKRHQGNIGLLSYHNPSISVLGGRSAGGPRKGGGGSIQQK